MDVDNQNQNTQDQELSTFVNVFTEGLGLDDIDPEHVGQQPATSPNADDQGSTVTATSTDDNSGTPESNTDTKNQPSASKNPNPGSQEDRPNVEEVFTKSDRAFAELRTTNKAYGDGFMRLARLAKMDAKNPAEAFEMLCKHMDQLEANNGNLTYADLARIQQEEKDLAAKEAQLQQQAHEGFEQLRRTFNLSNQDVLSFAEELKSKGINPFAQPVDLIAHYYSAHFNDLIEKAKEAGRQEEIARRTRAQTQATVPLSKNGGVQQDTGESINSTDALRAFLEQR